ncbi:unnamed protein product, partial [Notodromas monacha]
QGGSPSNLVDDIHEIIRKESERERTGCSVSSSRGGSYSPYTRRALGMSNSPNTSPNNTHHQHPSLSGRRGCYGKENSGCSPPIKRARKSLTESLSSPEPKHLVDLQFPPILTPETPSRSFDLGRDGEFTPTALLLKDNVGFLLDSSGPSPMTGLPSSARRFDQMLQRQAVSYGHQRTQSVHGEHHDPNQQQKARVSSPHWPHLASRSLLGLAGVGCTALYELESLKQRCLLPRQLSRDF